MRGIADRNAAESCGRDRILLLFGASYPIEARLFLYILLCVPCLPSLAPLACSGSTLGFPNLAASGCTLLD